ncbi:hypothetical protein LZ32DRAFT_168117 [Colletotrichum eremochloae]|nr:hypothetical protein LZ32DRAFT_168117 [Colletotrichum eremochloae]
MIHLSLELVPSYAFSFYLLLSCATTSTQKVDLFGKPPVASPSIFRSNFPAGIFRPNRLFCLSQHPKLTSCEA